MWHEEGCTQAGQDWHLHPQQKLSQCLPKGIDLFLNQISLNPARGGAQGQPCLQ